MERKNYFLLAFGEWEKKKTKQIDVIWGLRMILLHMSTRLFTYLANEISSLLNLWYRFYVLARFYLCILLADINDSWTRAGETTNTYFVEKRNFGSGVYTLYFLFLSFGFSTVLIFFILFNYLMRKYMLGLFDKLQEVQTAWVQGATFFFFSSFRM